MLAVATGVVHPLRGGWLIENPIRFPLQDSRWVVVIRQSQFHVFVDGEAPTDLGTFLNEIGSIVQGCLDALGFHLAIPLRAEVLSLVIDGSQLIYRDDQWADVLEGPPSKSVDSEKLGPFVSAALGDPLIRLALADLRTAIEAPDDTIMLCYRAIEAIRQWFLKGDKDDDDARKRSWIDMRNKLQFSESEIRRLEKKALGRRHGAVPPVTGEERMEALRLARKAVSALIAHRSM